MSLVEVYNVQYYKVDIIWYPNLILMKYYDNNTVFHGILINLVHLLSWIISAIYSDYKGKSINVNNSIIINNTALISLTVIVYWIIKV